MTNKERNMNLVKTIALFLLGGIGVIASAGAMNYGGIYLPAGIVNLGATAFSVYSLYKVLFK